MRILTKNNAIAWADEGVRVNAAHPGFVDTPIMYGVRGSEVEVQTLELTPNRQRALHRRWVHGALALHGSVRPEGSQTDARDIATDRADR